ncbi:MAG TPA: DUF2461 family protein [Symbiobacteriaceae bacterium]|nr:DUF2461 family protein [Symbiobacteriaceae bacterium]
MGSRFSEATLEFLAQAPFQGREWVARNRALYQAEVVEPQRALAEAAADFMAGLDAGLEASLSRIYRDARFSRGPALHESLWVTFQERNLAPEERPGFCFELYPDRYRYLMGFYSAGREKMERIRRRIDADPGRFAALVQALPPEYQVMGEAYKVSRAGHLPEVVRPWYDRKSFWVEAVRPIDELVLSERLVGFLQEQWALLHPLYRFVREA